MGTLRLARTVTVVAGLAVLAMLASGASAATYDVTTPFTDPAMVNPCNGDVVSVVGEAHDVIVTNDNKFEVQENWPDTSGMTATGTLYQVNDASHIFIVTVPEGSFTIGFRDSFELVSQDASSNFLVHETVEIKFDPKTGVSMKVTGAGADCSGTAAP